MIRRTIRPIAEYKDDHGRCALFPSPGNTFTVFIGIGQWLPDVFTTRRQAFAAFDMVIARHIAQYG